MTHDDTDTCLHCAHLATDHTREAGCESCGCSLTLTEQTNTCLPMLPVDHFGTSIPLFRYQDGNF